MERSEILHCIQDDKIQNFWEETMKLRNMTLYSIFVRNDGGTFAAVERDLPRRHFRKQPELESAVAYDAWVGRTSGGAFVAQTVTTAVNDWSLITWFVHSW